MIGTTISRYRILEKLGEGGMGEVYLAQDTSLDRRVALKFLSAELEKDATARKRFLREAKSAAAVDHPYICNIFEVGEAEGRAFLALEYVDGATLQARIAKGPLPLEDALRMGVEIAEALEEAHKRGIVHRDLKPANIMITGGGHVKVMDFGLAKHVSPPSEDTSQEQTLSALTRDGATPGTLAYMSPEQLRAEPVDARSDLFSFGIVLYEMLAGVHPFRRGEGMETASAILKEDPPPLARYRDDASDVLQHVVGKMLTRNRDDRYQQAHDVVTDLRGCASTPAHPATPARSGAFKWGLAIAGLTVAVVAVLAAVLLRGPGDPDEAAGPLEIVPLTSYRGEERQPTFNPDGSQVAFSWDGPERDNHDIYVKVVGATEPLRLTTDPARDGSPAWSPDGRQIAFLRETQVGVSEIRLIPPTGGPERVVTTVQAHSDWGLSWTSDGRSLAAADRGAPGQPAAIVLVDMESVEKQRLTEPPPLGFGDRYPAFSPDDRIVAFKRQSSVQILDRESGKTQPVSDASYGFGLGWTSDGREVVLSTSPRIELSAPAFGNTVWRISIEDAQARVLAGTQDAADVAVSRQGDRVVYARGAPGYDIWRIDTTTGQLAPFISSSSFDVNPQYSPGGDKISFASFRSGAILNYVGNPDGTNLLSLGLGCGSARWSPDGDHLVCDADSGKGDSDIFVVSASGGPRRPITKKPSSDEHRPSWSSAGDWIYFGSNRTGDWQVWRVPATGEEPGNAVQVTRGGGNAPIESADGRYVYYAKTRASARNPETAIWRVPARGGLEEPVIESLSSADSNWDLNAQGLYFVDRLDGSDSPWVVNRYDFATGSLTQLAQLPYTPGLDGPSLGVSPDGRWILSVESSSDWDLMLVENFR